MVVVHPSFPLSILIFASVKPEKVWLLITQLLKSRFYSLLLYQDSSNFSEGNSLKAEIMPFFLRAEFLPQQGSILYITKSNANVCLSN